MSLLNAEEIAHYHILAGRVNWAIALLGRHDVQHVISALSQTKLVNLLYVLDGNHFGGVAVAHHLQQQRPLNLLYVLDGNHFGGVAVAHHLHLSRTLNPRDNPFRRAKNVLNVPKRCDRR
jgi:hypothetical protein